MILITTVLLPPTTVLTWFDLFGSNQGTFFDFQGNSLGKQWQLKIKFLGFCRNTCDIPSGYCLLWVLLDCEALKTTLNRSICISRAKNSSQLTSNWIIDHGCTGKITRNMNPPLILWIHRSTFVESLRICSLVTDLLNRDRSSRHWFLSSPLS